MKSTARVSAPEERLGVLSEEELSGKTRRPALGFYRALLLHKKAEFLVALGVNCQKLAEAGQECGADPEQVSHDESVRVRLNRVLYGQLRQVEDALDRLEVGEYGICMDCGAPIATKRLQAVPWARYCVECQEKASSRYAMSL